jgi:tRNA (cytidine/uridine-2'-O-)-methyltransferase
MRCAATVTATSGPPSSEPGWNFVNSGSRREWQRPDLHIVLVNPQIPQNAGNISRTCAAASIALHLVGPMGFELDNAKLKRAGLDYWDWVACKVHPSWDEFYSFFNQLDDPNKRLVGFSKLGTTHHATEGMYPPGTWLMFGAETTGLPPEAHTAAVESGGAIVKIPMSNYKHVRSLNLATSVGIGVFEALRQLDGAVLPEDVPGQEEGEASAEAANIEAASTPK